MKFDVDRITRSNIRTMVPYSSARSEYPWNDAVLMDANENPYNTPYNRYPDPLQSGLKSRIADVLGAKKDHIFLGNGSDEAIDLLIRAFCEPGRSSILVMEPSYGMYAVCAQVNDVAVRRVKLDEQFQPDLNAVAGSTDDSTRIAFFCSPNNPSGNLLDASRLERVLRSFAGLVVIDEAYVDFSNSAGWLERLDEFPNLVVLRTFSKAWGMAGVRLGMAVAGERIIDILNRIKYPYNVSMLTRRKVLSMLKWARRKNDWVGRILKERDRLRDRLASLNVVEEVFPSDANFLLVRFGDAAAVLDYLRRHKVIVRDRSTLHLCRNCLRLTVGTPGENKLLLRHLSNFQKKNS